MKKLFDGNERTNSWNSEIEKHKFNKSLSDFQKKRIQDCRINNIRGFHYLKIENNSRKKCFSF